MNENLLQQVKAHILAEPKRLVMSHYVVRRDDHTVSDTKYIPCRTQAPDVYMLREFPPCGTAACIAGWGGLLHSGMEYFFEHSYAAVFDLNPWQAARLFNPRMWPEKFERGTWDDGSPETARATADRIDFFIETKGTDRVQQSEREIVFAAEVQLQKAMDLMTEFGTRSADDVIRFAMPFEVVEPIDAPRETVLQEA